MSSYQTNAWNGNIQYLWAATGHVKREDFLMWENCMSDVCSCMFAQGFQPPAVAGEKAEDVVRGSQKQNGELKDTTTLPSDFFSR